MTRRSVPCCWQSGAAGCGRRDFSAAKFPAGPVEPNMRNKKLFLALTGAALLCGCDRQTRLNTEKIESLSQKMLQLQQTQAKQMAVFQTQLTQIAPMMDKMNSIYF